MLVITRHHDLSLSPPSSFLLLPFLLLTLLSKNCHAAPNWCNNANTIASWSGSHTLPTSSECALPSPVEVEWGTSLDLSAAAAPAATLYSTDRSTVHFYVRGELTLTDLILESGLGSALVIQGLPLGDRAGGFPAPRATLLRSTVRGCTTSLHTSRGGAAVFATGLGVSLVLEGSTFEDNVAHGTAASGGAILATAGVTVEVRSSTFHNNSATGSGGAIACLGCHSVVVLGNSRFEKNQAALNGGAFAVVDALAYTTPTSTGALFLGNEAVLGNGGAVFVHDASGQGAWTSRGDLFRGNNATTGSGGALAAVGTKMTLAEASRCTGNHALLGVGGCIFWEPLTVTRDAEAWDRLAPDLKNT